MPILFAGVQLAPGPKPVNPPVDPAHTIVAQVPVPPNIERLLYRSCGDCHSNTTHWPWYSGLAPARWKMASDLPARAPS